jgi:hypothetical protein
MTLVRRKNLRNKFYVSTDAGSTWVELGAVVNAEDLGGGGADEVDATILYDTFKQKQCGQKDPGSFALTIAFDEADTTTATLLDIYYSGDNVLFKVEAAAFGSNAAVYIGPFEGYLDDVKVMMDKGDMRKARVSIKISGDPGYSH